MAMADFPQLAKTLGPALLIYISGHPSASSDIQMAAQILYQVALGPLMSATLSFVNTSPGDNKADIAYAPLASIHKKTSSMILTLVHPVIMVGLVLGIIGGVDRAPDDSGTIDQKKYERGATFSKASAALFLIAFAGILFGTVRLWKQRKYLATVSFFIVSCMPVVLPLLFVRILYSLLNAANMDTTGHAEHSDKFNVMTGSWVIYLFMGFVPQAGIILVYVCSGVLARMRTRNTEQG